MVEAPGHLSFLVLGNDTQVGQAVCQYLQQREIPFSSVPLATAERELGAMLDSIREPSWRYVINTLFEEPASSESVDTAVWLALNERIAKACAQADKVLLQISSARVFAGDINRPYAETDPPDSSDALGGCYRQMEQAVAQHCPRSVLLRTSWLFSAFVDNFLTRLVDVAVRQETLKVSGLLRGNPTDACVVARVLVAMTEQIDCAAEPDLWGTYHYADSDGCTLFTFAKTVITVVKSMAEVRVETIEEGGVDEHAEQAPHAENHQLSCKKILSTFGIKQRPWRRGVHEVLKQKFAAG